MDFGTLFSTTNPVFSGGFGLAVLAAGAQALRFGSQVGMKMLRRHFLSTLEITSKDQSYPWMLRWLAVTGGKTQHLSVQTSFISKAGSFKKMNFDFVPGPGQHLLNYNGNFMLVQRIREQQLDFNTGKPWEKVQLTAFGRNTTVFETILSEAYELSVTRDEGKTIIYTNWGSEWREFGQPRAKRPIQSVVLDTNVAESLLADVQEWTESASWYRDRGIPYRRGYLLHGPPGSGKSSFIMALAGKLGYNICILNLSERGLTDDRLALALSNIPPQSLVLLEDIDAAFLSREESALSSDANSRSSDVTFSGLLNVLDGVSSSEDRLVFMTTNYIERLDPALIRPGRVDYVQLVGNATTTQMETLFSRFYPEVSSETARQFSSVVEEVLSCVSMAILQGHLLRYKNDPVRAIEEVRVLAKSMLDNNSNSTIKRRSNYSVKESSKIDGRKKLARTLSIEEIDKMYFNPQPDWDKGLKQI